MIEARSLTKSYGGKPAVRGVDFTIHPGEVVGLLGPNGAGKTTIMKMLTAYHFPTEGQLSIFGRDVYTQEQEIKAILGYLPENAPHYPEFTVREYLSFVADARIGRGKTPSGLDAATAIDKAIRDCSLEEVEHRLVDELSKGYRQRLGLAQAILHEPQFLILDEPTTGLDPNQILEIRRLIRGLREGRTIILSTHILQEVEAVCDRVLIIHQGQIVAQGKTQDIADELRGETVLEVVVTGAKSGLVPGLSALAGVRRVEEDSLILTQVGEIPRSGDEGAPLGLKALRIRLERDPALSWTTRAHLGRHLMDQGCAILHLAARSASLEDLFVRLTNGEGNDEQ